MWAKIKAQLVPDWQHFYKWYSVHISAVLAVVAGFDIHDPTIHAFLSQYIGQKWLPLIGFVILLAGRLYKQGKKNVQP